MSVQSPRPKAVRAKVLITKGDARARRALIAEAPPQLGASWASILCERLRLEGRSVDGGWPGTLSESRSRVRGHLDRELLERGLPPLDHLELEQAAAAMYERAKCDWLELIHSRRTSRRRAQSKVIHEA